MIDKELIHQAAEDIDIFQADLTEEYDRIKKSLSPRPLPKERGLKFWPLAIAACLAGFVVIFLAPPRTTEEPIASSQEPRVESQVPTTSSQEPIASSQEPIASSQEPRANSQRPKANSQQATQPSPKGGDGGGLPKAKSQQPIAEPMLTEAEIERGAHPEMEDPLLAVAAQIQDIRSRGERLGREIAQLTDNKIKYQ